MLAPRDLISVTEGSDKRPSVDLVSPTVHLTEDVFTWQIGTTSDSAELTSPSIASLLVGVGIALASMSCMQEMNI